MPEEETSEPAAGGDHDEPMLGDSAPSLATSEPGGISKRERLLRVALRWAVGALFVSAGLAKLFAHAQTTGILLSRGLPQPSLLAVSVGVAEVLGGLLLLSAWKVRWVAALLASFVAVATLLLHFPLTLAGPQAFEFGLAVGVLVALYAVASKDPSLRISSSDAATASETLNRARQSAR